MPLETGTYTIAHVDFRPRPDPLSRPLGLNAAESEVVILKAGSPSPKWKIEKLANGKFIVSISDKAVTPVGNTVGVSKEDKYEWTVIPGAPHPPPIGKDNYAFSTGSQSWGYKEGSEDIVEEIEITLEQVARTWHIVKV